jgi:redox-sensitive bicupin YhaK (pirin superfamily)
MSELPSYQPECLDTDTDAIELLIQARARDIGDFAVRRALPAARRRLVGPFIFFDHMGPVVMPVGHGLDVRPHPHIALATVTYLFDGEIDHRDSLGSFRTIRPGDVNWMVAGRGIVHSERSGQGARLGGVHLHGIQSWVALPLEHEETEPRFDHHPAATLPKLNKDGAMLDVIAGTAFGLRSPVAVFSPTLYVHARLEAGGRVQLDTEHEQRAVYVVEGTIGCDGRTFEAGSLLVLRAGVMATLTSQSGARLMLIGGAKLAGERHIYWNFVASSEERIERAKDDWRNERFPTVPGDDVERIPLPEEH